MTQSVYGTRQDHRADPGDFTQEHSPWGLGSVENHVSGSEVVSSCMTSVSSSIYVSGVGVPGAAAVALPSSSTTGGRGVSASGGCWGASVGVGGMGSTRPVALGSPCGRLSSPAGLGISAAAAVAVAVVVVAVVSASVVAGATVVGGPAGACVPATVILKGEAAGGSVGSEVTFAGPGKQIYFLVM